MLLDELHVEHSPWKPQGGHRNYAEPQEGTINEVLIRDGQGEILGAELILPLDDDLHMLANILRMELKFDDGTTGTSQARASGIRYDSKVFGFTDPKPLRKRYGASIASVHREYPALSDIIERLTRRMWESFVEVNPQEAERHEKIVRDNLHPDWCFAGVPFTSGIINKNGRLPYHRDRGNLAGTWSVMLCLRGNMGGGALHLPEYEVALGIPDRSVTMFNGQNAWHGVTPMQPLNKKSYRFTLVWYAKSGFRVCGSLEDEPKRAAIAATI